MSDCTTCTERQGYYLDAETIANQQEHIAELEADRDHWRELFCEQAGDTLTLDRENAELKSLVMDMYGSLWTVSESWAYDSYHERMADLGLLEGDAE